MATVKEIQAAIKALPSEEYRNLMRWLHEKDWEDWDDAIERDAKAGHLEFLKQEAIPATSASTRIDT